ncbi:MAG: ATP-binding protein [Pyrinomonadaceae bacterium MAG19_C2-C3]|nr:ATP-binding protein [Pyrinomonadaceae bacterium MAG19_C2-C3]
MDAVIFIGIQASGKTSFYRERFFLTHVRLSLDMLRTRHRERLLFNACLAAKQSLVVDNTNPSVAERAHYIIPARAAGFRVVGYYFRSNILDALRRNETRAGVACVPDKGIYGTHGRLQLPKYDEGFDELRYVRLTETNEFIVEDWKG